ncbi:hypothetical protein PR001_g21779 [Phytophthora rubi]|uniref:Uncharacterized protein n=1 Tax=Phytophthora rubi TaxID=129364 RepID=A0A6A3J7J5_9STRA|nr:hypothetical protein PR001_g21779 [Phytophthora rubi]
MLVAGPASANTARPCYAGTPRGFAAATLLATASLRWSSSISHSPPPPKKIDCVRKHSRTCNGTSSLPNHVR